MSDEHPFEYYETHMEERSGESALALVEPMEPPRESGTGWVLVERFRSGALIVFRWRRPRVKA
jgi:hypothetical protein